MRYALLFIILCIGLSSGCKLAPPADKTTSTYVIPNFFSVKPSRVLFKVNMKIAKEEFSGMMIIKETATAEYRTIFTTGPGIKVFDFTVRNDGYTVNYALGPLSKKFIANRLNYTIQALLLRPFHDDSKVINLPSTSDYQIYKAGKYSYRVQIIDGKVNYQEVFYKNRKKAMATFGYGPTSEIPDSGFVSHVGFPLQATFKLLEQ